MKTIVVANLVLVVLATFSLCRRWSRFRGTTLVAPAVWSIISLLLIGGIEIVLAMAWTDADPTTIEMLQYLAATSTFCPLMAVLGAKRPQDKGWQWIVLTLWIVLILPVGSTLVLWRGGTLDIGPFRQWFLVILMLVGFFNYALTRFGFSAFVFTAAQVFLLLPWLPIVGTTWQYGWMLGIVLVAAAVAIAWWQTRRESQVTGWNRVWTDFRDAYGLVWGLRVMERINSTARLCNWESELGWFGFEKTAVSETEMDETERTVNTLLRRFVSPEWIEKRRTSAR